MTDNTATPPEWATNAPLLRWAPLGDQIIVLPLLAAEQIGSFVVPDAVRERPQRGIVLAVGPGLPSELTTNVRETATEPGDLVLFGQFAGAAIDLDGLEVLLMRDQEALARVPPGAYELVKHTNTAGKDVFHEAGQVCDICRPAAEPAPAAEPTEPPPPTKEERRSAYLEEERERVRRDREARETPTAERARVCDECRSTLPVDDVVDAGPGVVLCAECVVKRGTVER